MIGVVASGNVVLTLLLPRDISDEALHVLAAAQAKEEEEEEEEK